ncbi:acyl-CoA dehydrogenase [Aquabacterium fontiphilum]|uniref:acyl-CoA dehydrogenase n=1 Tax=Aquabacterium fontiphilum TaxID=450365 RepID=UPI0013768FDC|nr:acyl-CoA dehydrogenase [Aquabacterium fontiphilum]NBD19671.1 acyl-CoA dehydrogenase [Aquabacterium fontiphilum]
MSSYHAPLREMRFTMQEVAGLRDVCALPGHEDASPELVEAILEEAGRFASGVLDPLNWPGDQQGARWDQGVVRAADGFREAYAQFCEAGWHGMPAAPAFGGQGLPTLVSTAVMEMWKASNMAFSLCQMLTMGAVEALVRHGSPALQQRFLPKMVSGQWTGTMNLTEPQAGSDLSAIRTRATPEGDHYRISGTKIFITWGEHDMAENIVHLVLARLPDAPEGVKGISLFVCPKFLVNEDGTLGARNDLVCSAIEHKLGIHASPTAVMSFGDGPGAIGYLVGEPHKGLGYMFTMMNHARLNVGLEGVAVSDRAYQRARAYALDRVQGRTLTGHAAIIGHPDVRRMLMDMKCRVEAMRGLAYFTSAQMDRAHAHESEAVRAQAQALVDLLIPIVKGWCTETAQQVAADGVQVHGGMGFIEETGAAQYVRDVRITTIYEGTTGIQANDLIGRKLVRDEGATMKALWRTMSAEAQRQSDSPDASLRQLGQSLQRALDALSQATDWLLTQAARQPAATAAAAVPYLHLCGTVVAGWLMNRAAEGAVLRRQGADADAAFLQARLVVAQHYHHHMLVSAPAWRDRVVNGAASTLALADDQF